MATIAIFGGTGFAGGAIRDEALRRGHSVIAVSRSGGAPVSDPGLQARAGSIHDDALVDGLAAEADVIVVAIPAREIDGKRGADAVGSLTSAAAKHGTRVGVVGGAGSLHVSEGGPRLVDSPEFPDLFKSEALAAADVLAALRATSDDVSWFYVSPAGGFGRRNPGEATGAYRTGDEVLLTDANGESNISGADFALAFVDEIEDPKHHNKRFTVAY